MLYKILFILTILLILLFIYNFLYKKHTKNINNKINQKTKNKIKKLQTIIKKIILHLKAHHPNHSGIKNAPLNIVIKPLSKDSPYKVGYSLNKKIIYICLEEHNENELYFVLLHEFSHFITKSIGHTKEFWNNFKLVLNTAIKLNIYKYTNYKYNPKTYCNKLIDHTPI